MSAILPSTRAQAALEFLQGRVNYEKIPPPPGSKGLKLARMRDLLSLLGEPAAGIPVIHVAGTKGKGSTSTMLQAALTAAGYKTGLYVSPHLERVEERFVVDGQPCTEEELADLVERVRPAVEALDRECELHGRRGATYFEITTAMAFLHFARRGVAAMVLEVGLGGRLDSTNVCRPAVTVITSISFDHMAQLGDTLALIAGEKAGIIKPGVPCVSGVIAAEPREVIAAVARSQGSRLVQAGQDFRFEYRPPASDAGLAGQIDFHYENPGLARHWERLALRMPGRHQAANAACAVAALCELERLGWQLPEAAIRRGLAEARCAARVELVSHSPLAVLDGAHNVASVEALANTLDECFPRRPRWLVFGASVDKDVAGMVRTLLPRFDGVVLTRYRLNPRGIPVDELERLAAPWARRPPLVAADPKAAWDLVRAAAPAEALICVSGSFFLAAEMRRWMCPLGAALPLPGDPPS